MERALTLHFVDGTKISFDFDEQGHHIGIGPGQSLTSTSAGVWRAGATANTTLYGTFRPRLGQLVGLRHIVTPSATFAFSPATSAGNRFNDFGGFGVSGGKLPYTATFHYPNRKEPDVSLACGN